MSSTTNATHFIFFWFMSQERNLKEKTSSLSACTRRKRWFNIRFTKGVKLRKLIERRDTWLTACQGGGVTFLLRLHQSITLPSFDYTKERKKRKIISESIWWKREEKSQTPTHQTGRWCDGGVPTLLHLRVIHSIPLTSHPIMNRARQYNLLH